MSSDPTPVEKDKFYPFLDRFADRFHRCKRHTCSLKFEIVFGGPSHVDTTYISLGPRSENFWSLRNTPVSNTLEVYGPYVFMLY